MSGAPPGLDDAAPGVQPGRWVQRVDVPSGLTRDLPPGGAVRVIACKSQRMRMTETDAHGYSGLGAKAQSAGRFCVQRSDVPPWVTRERRSRPGLRRWVLAA